MEEERFIPGQDDQMTIEHLHRYENILSFIKNKSVLDIASGDGYGSYLMSRYASEVYGVDICKKTIAKAKKKYLNKNLTFISDSILELKNIHKKFDVVVSFETLEHLKNHKKIIENLKQCLKPQGVLIISTPNKPVYKKFNPSNPFHLKELNFKEFDELIRPFFRHIKYCAQKLMISSIISSDENIKDKIDFKTYSNKADLLDNKFSNSIEDATYFIAICSEYKIRKIDTSMFLPKKNDLINVYLNHAKWAQDQDLQIQHLTEAVNHLKRVASDQKLIKVHERSNTKFLGKLKKNIFLKIKQYFN